VNVNGTETEGAAADAAASERPVPAAARGDVPYRAVAARPTAAFGNRPSEMFAMPTSESSFSGFQPVLRRRVAPGRLS